MEQGQVKLQTIKANLKLKRPDLVGEDLERTAYILYLRLNGKSDDHINTSLPKWEKQRQLKSVKKDALNGKISAEEYQVQKKALSEPRKNGVQKQYNDWASRVKSTAEYSGFTHSQLVSEAARLYKEGHTEQFRSLEEIESDPIVKAKKSKSKGPKTILDIDDSIDSALTLNAKRQEAKATKPLSRLEQVRQKVAQK